MSSTEARSAASLADPAAYAAGVPYAQLARLRAAEPVCWVDEPPLIRHGPGGAAALRGTGYWAVTSYAEVSAVSRDPVRYSSAAKGVFIADPRSRADVERNRDLLISMDVPRHTKVRQVARAAFTPRAVRELRASVAAHARALTGQVVRAQRFDAVRDLAAELPLLVLADLLGIPREDRTLLYRWSNSLVGFDDPDFGGGDIAAYQRTFAEAFGYALQAARERRRNPREDLITLLITSQPGGQRLTEAEYCGLWLLLVVAGNETTRNLISGGLLALTQWPGERDRLVRDPRIGPAAVEEMLRWVSPIMQFRRTATADAELAGQPISAGDKVVLYYIAANRDEAVFTNADRFDVSREPNPHLAFGLGRHFCLGAHLARIEAVTMFDVLRPYLAGFELAGPPARVESNFMNGLKSMPALITAGPGTGRHDQHPAWT
jgi:cytochrome P450